MDREEFKPEYGLKKLKLITPTKRDFKMLVTPGFYVNWYGSSVFEDFTSDLLLNLSKDNTLFIDIGAHYGYYTLLVGTRHPGCKIIAFEPVPENFEKLKQNAALNQLGNTELHNLAVSNRDELRKFRVTEISSRSSLYEQPWENISKEIEVRTICLDGFLKETPKVPVIIKMDVEGHETYVLRGMRKLLRNSEDIKLIIEFNPRCLRNAGSEPTEFLKEVFKYGFDIYVIDDNKRTTYKLKPDNLKNWIDYLPERDENRNANLLCIKKEKSLSLLFFSHSSQLAGAERSLLELSKQLVIDYGVICSVVLPNEGPLRGKFDEAGISTLTIDYHWWCGGNIPSPEEVRVGLSSSFENALNKLGDLGKINPDIILTSTLVIPWGAVAASFLDKPHVWSIREFGELDHKLKFHLSFQTILKIIRDSSNLILTNSNAVKNTLFGTVPSENILTLYPHIDIPSSIINKDENSYFTRTEATKLIIFGTVMESKGQKDAILAVKELIQRRLDVELIVMGYAEPVYLEQLKEIIEGENLGAYVKFIDFKENPYPVVNQADIAIVCSRNEALGRITLESMLLRKPVIGTNTGGTQELIKEGFNGFLYEPEDYYQLADKIEHLIRRREKIVELGENGYKFVKENFTKEKSSGLLVDLLRELKGTVNNSSGAFSQFTKGATLTTLSNLKSLIDHKDSQITELNNVLQAKDTRIINLNNVLQAKESQLRKLDVTLEEKNSQITELSNALQAKQEENTAFHNEIQALRGEITQIQNSLGWRIVHKYRIIMDKFFPTSSWRRKFYVLAQKSVKVFLTEGFLSFGRKIFFRLRSLKKRYF